MSPLLGLSGFGGGVSRFGGLVGEPSDGYFNYVSLLLNGNGTNGAQNNTFLDSSNNNFTITRNGNTTQGSFSPYDDRWSNYFDGDGDYLTVGSASDWSFLSNGQNTWTLSCNVYLQESREHSLLCTNVNSITGAIGVWVKITTDGKIAGSFTAGTDGYRLDFTSNNSTNIFPPGQWHSLSFTFTHTNSQGSYLSMIVNGVSYSGFTEQTIINNSPSGSTFSFSTGTPAFPVHIGTLRGAVTGTGNFLLGYISNYSILSGTQRLLTCQSNRFKDNSSNNYTLTSVGNVSVQRFNPSLPTSSYNPTVIGGSGYFDGSGDYLSLASNSAFGFGSGDFTMECWFYKIGTNLDVLIDTRIGAGGNVNGIALYVQENILKAGNNAERISGGVINTNSWNHCALVRSGNNLYLYLNGNRTASVAFSTTLSTSSSPYIGTSATSEFSNGYISDVRLLKGTAQYTGTSYTVPTSPLTSITNTSVLCNFTNGAIFDQTAINDLETQGNAQISSSVKKYGTGSLYFDGSGDRVSIINTPQLNLGLEDFTIECWAYSITPLSSYNIQYAHIAGKGNGIAAGTYSLSFYTSQFTFTFEGTFVQGSSTLTNNTWYHLAVTRSGSTLRLFVNGILDSTTTNSTALTSGFSFNVGDRQSGDLSAQYPFNGYVDDLRITKGIARYTTSFTPPTREFPNK